jgi:hypothetical protein
MRRFLAGIPLGQLRRELDQRGVPTVAGGRWEASSIARILMSPRIAGWQGELGLGRGAVARPFLVRAQWPAIVSRRAVESAQALYTDDTRRPGSANTHLLSNLAVCGVCQLPLTCGHYDRDRERRYVCDQRDRATPVAVTIGESYLDQLVVQRITEAVHAGVIDRLLAEWDQHRHRVAESLRVNRLRLAGVLHEGQNGLLTGDAYVVRKLVYRHAVQRAELLLADGPEPAALRAMPTDPAAFTARFDQLDRRTQRALIRTVTSKITILREDRRHPDHRTRRIKIQWAA